MKCSTLLVAREIWIGIADWALLHIYYNDCDFLIKIANIECWWEWSLDALLMKIKVGIKNEFNSLHRKINNCLDIFKEKISDQTHSKKNPST